MSHDGALQRPNEGALLNKGRVLRAREGKNKHESNKSGAKKGHEAQVAKSQQNQQLPTPQTVQSSRSCLVLL